MPAIAFLLEVCANINITITIQLNKLVHLVYHHDRQGLPKDLQNDDSGHEVVAIFLIVNQVVGLHDASQIHGKRPWRSSYLFDEC